MTPVQDIIDAADPSTQEGIDNLAAQVNQELATRIAEEIFTMDHFSAQGLAVIRIGRNDYQNRMIEVAELVTEFHDLLLTQLAALKVKPGKEK